jgi:type III restriction enzyme
MEAVVGADGVTRQLFKPEYVNIFGVPLSIFQDVFQDVGDGGEAPPSPKSSTQIETLAERNSMEIKWPNVVRVDTVLTPVLSIDWQKVSALTLDPANTPITVDIAPALGGAADWNKVTTIDLEQLPDEFRLQRLVFKAARKAFDSLQQSFKGNKEYLVLQLIRLIEQFLKQDKLDIPSLFHQDPLRKRILITLNMDVVIQHLLRYLVEQNHECIEPVFDSEFPIGSTQNMRTWYTTKPCLPTVKSQISHVVGDSGWEGYVANVLEKSPLVQSYAKNDHLGFQIYYLWNGSKRRYIPDLLIRLTNGKTLILEVKGQDSEMAKAKLAATKAWVEGVNHKGGFGVWASDILFEPAKIHDVLENIFHGNKDIK